MSAILCRPQCVKGRLWEKEHDDVIKWKHFPRYWPFVRGIHRGPVNSPHRGQWRGAFMFSLICVWINGWVNNREAGDLRRYLAHYDVIVMGRKVHVNDVGNTFSQCPKTVSHTVEWQIENGAGVSISSFESYRIMTDVSTAVTLFKYEHHILYMSATNVRKIWITNNGMTEHKGFQVLTQIVMGM